MGSTLATSTTGIMVKAVTTENKMTTVTTAHFYQM
jgi:hypothetical protein